MTNKEILDKLFSEHDAFRYVQWLRGSSCLSCKIKSFCDSYYRNRAFSSCGIAARTFLAMESDISGKAD